MKQLLLLYRRERRSRPTGSGCGPGLRPIQFWVPDVHSPEFAAEAHRQSLLVAQSEQEKDDQDFVDSISELAEWYDGK